jgi:hypothetical protein
MHQDEGKQLVCYSKTAKVGIANLRSITVRTAAGTSPKSFFWSPERALQQLLSYASSVTTAEHNLQRA